MLFLPTLLHPSWPHTESTSIPMKTTAPYILISLVAAISFGCQNDQSTQPKQAIVPDPQPQLDDDTALTPALLRESIAQAYAANDFKAAADLADKINLNGPLPIDLLYGIGEAQFAVGKPAQAIAAYDRIIVNRPDLKPRLWQRGLALYYAGDYKGGVDQLESHQNFNSQDVENSVWHLMMKAKISSVDAARKEMIQINRDRRKPMKEIFDMFAGTGSPAVVLDACGYNESTTVRDSATYHGWLYIGLYHEMMGDQQAAIRAMEKAVKFNPLSTGLMAHIASTHLLMHKNDSAAP